MKFCKTCGKVVADAVDNCWNCCGAQFSPKPSVAPECQRGAAPEPQGGARNTAIEPLTAAEGRQAEARQAAEAAQAASQLAEVRRAAADTPVCCPKRGSVHVAAQKHGFTALRAVGGFVSLGGIGLIAGLHGSRRVDLACTKCGHVWAAADAHPP